MLPLPATDRPDQLSSVRLFLPIRAATRGMWWSQCWRVCSMCCRSCQERASDCYMRRVLTRPLRPNIASRCQVWRNILHSLRGRPPPKCSRTGVLLVMHCWEVREHYSVYRCVRVCCLPRGQIHSGARLFKVPQLCEGPLRAFFPHGGPCRPLCEVPTWQIPRGGRRHKV